ncbi:SusD/RagB family nutrient-binding outer membrane lipoprotein [Psychroflexus sp. MBR-150]|jgi:hypothetical protein
MNKLKIFSILFFAFLLVGCEDYLDVNTSPNNPTAETIKPDLLLASALSKPYSDLIGRTDRSIGPVNGLMPDFSNVFMNNWAGDVNNFTAAFIDEYQLSNITSNFYDGIWDQTYRGLATHQLIIDEPSENFDNHKAIARIMKSFYFQRLVDLYGDLPYTEALQGGDNLTPVYDNQVDVYRALVEDLDFAISEINSADNEDALVGGEDIIFQGDMSQWIRFANTIKLKILIRQSNLAETDGATQTYLNEQFANLQNDFITQNVTINPGYSNDVNKQNPFYTIYGADSEGNVTDPGKLIVPSDYCAEFLKGQQTENGIQTGVFDKRVNQLFTQIGGEVIGVQQGADNTTAPSELSKLGPGVLKGSEQDGIIMTASESFFLQSEAVFRGYLGGDAKSLFQDGIRSSFRLLGLTNAEADNYIASSNNTNLIGWDGSANKIEAIMTQKWIATNSFTAIESWIDYVRTGYPDIPLAITATKPAKPNRLLYPVSEFSTNTENVPNQTQQDAFTTKIFWDVN